MTVIRSFADLDHINNYYKLSLNHPSMILLSQDNLSSLISTYSLSAFSDNSDYLHNSYYLYPASKTVFRKELHSNIPNVLYKNFYTTLKHSGHIVAATGTYVLLVDKPIDQSIFNVLKVESKIDDHKVLNQLLDNFSNITSDNEYYINYIASLEKKYQDTLAENEQLKNQLYNTKISTWY